jgi:hypothetical protein
MAKGLCEPLQQQQFKPAILFTMKYLYFAKPTSVKGSEGGIGRLSRKAGQKQPAHLRDAPAIHARSRD